MSDLTQRVQAALQSDPQVDPGYRSVLDTLHEVAHAIAAAGGIADALVRAVPGFETNLGQEVKVVLSIPSQPYQETLFRAYVPTDGFPVALDLYGEATEPCADTKELEDRIIGFLASAPMRTKFDLLARLQSDG